MDAQPLINVLLKEYNKETKTAVEAGQAVTVSKVGKNSCILKIANIMAQKQNRSLQQPFRQQER